MTTCYSIDLEIINEWGQSDVDSLNKLIHVINIFCESSAGRYQRVFRRGTHQGCSGYHNWIIYLWSYEPKVMTLWCVLVRCFKLDSWLVGSIENMMWLAEKSIEIASKWKPFDPNFHHPCNHPNLSLTFAPETSYTTVIPSYKNRLNKIH